MAHVRLMTGSDVQLMEAIRDVSNCGDGCELIGFCFGGVVILP